MATDTTLSTPALPTPANPTDPLKTPASTATGTGLMSTGGTPSFNEATGQTAAPSTSSTTSSASSPTLLNLNSLTQRTVDQPTQTVAGNLNTLLSSGSPYLASAESAAQQYANSRGLMNSTMAATAGEKAAIDAAMPIATADASTYGKAADYNTSLANQGTMYNTDTTNQFTTAKNAQDAQQNIAQLQSDTSKYGVDKQAQTAANTTAEDLAKAKLNNNMSLINNIIQSVDLSPDRKAALLKELNAPGLASAIFVVDTTAADLAGGQTTNSVTGEQLTSPTGQPLIMQGGVRGYIAGRSGVFIPY